jgi:hypothetical protein
MKTRLPVEKKIADAEKDRHLLVRVLAAAALDATKVASIEVMPMPNPPQKDMQINKLHITSHSISPDFKILLFPYRDGKPLPTTTWSSDSLTVTISCPDQKDQVTFTPSKDGRTRLKIVRGGETVQIE